MIEKYTPQELVVSDAAVSRIDKLVSDEVNKEISLRVFVTGGGCSGFQYGFRLEDQLDEEDTVLKKWYENGQKKEEGNFINGEQQGRWTYYNKDGTLDGTEDY